MIDQANRIVLLLLGLVLCVVGVLGILLSQGALPVLEPSAIYESLKRTIAVQPAVWWVVIVLAGLLIAILGLYYAVRQVAVRPGHRLDRILLRRHDLGTTRLEPAAVNKAVTRDLDRMDDVSGSRVRLRSYLPQPSLGVRLDVDERANVTEVRARADEAFERVRRTLGTDDVDVDLQLRLRPPPPEALARVE